MKQIIFILLCLYLTTSFAQMISSQGDGEVLYELETNPQIFNKNSTENNVLKKAVTSTRNYFLIDTLKLPFTDDFSSNFFKSYNPADYPGALVFDSVAYLYLINGTTYFDTLIYKSDTSYKFAYDTSSKITTTTKLDSTQVVGYKDAINPWTPTDTTYYWPPYNLYDTTGNPTVILCDSACMTKVTRLINVRDTVSVYPPDSVSKWIDAFAFLNNDYPVNPVTIGVATLDGVNEKGRPYNFTNPTAWGIADYLTSKPIDMSVLNPFDSIYFSFFCQPEGNGNYPQAEDSLVLQFYETAQNTWQSVWNMNGSKSYPFRIVMIPVTDSKYLTKGFKFRFLNYATLSGNLDHWNIDYVYLASGRSFSDTAMRDIAARAPSGSLLKNYESVPWKHYLKDTSGTEFFMIDSMVAGVSNLYNAVQNVTHSYQVTNDKDSTYTFSFGNKNISGNTIDSISTKLSYKFYSPSADSASFTVKIIFHPQLPQVDANQLNDTAIYIQRFYNYYAYDDGTVEKGYGLVNVNGGQIAYRFTLSQSDTLRGMQIYFNQILEDVSSKSFYVTVWNDAGGKPGSIIYQKATNDNPVYKEKHNDFHFYLFDKTVVVSGTFYVGLVQITDKSLNIGLDANRNASQNIFYNINGPWLQTVFTGALMIHPMFGDTVLMPAQVEPVKSYLLQEDVAIYPSPAHDRIYLNTSPFSDEGNNYVIRIYTIDGRQALDFNNVKDNEWLNISSLARGLYILNIYNTSTQNFSVKKLIVTE